jgi:hypothetical protein
MKEFKLGIQQNLEQGLESVLQVVHQIVSGVHQTVSGAPGRAPSQLATLEFFQGAIRYNSPDCPVCTRHVQ